MSVIVVVKYFSEEIQEVYNLSFKRTNPTSIIKFLV